MATTSTGHYMLTRQTSIDVLTLIYAADRCDLIPGIGGSIAAWAVNGEPMMRAATAASIDARDPFGMASFPLVPFSNRVGNGTFPWDGQLFALTRNFYPEPHAIHGVGFESPWQVRAHTAASATLVLNHRPCAAWPFAFEARQRITLGAGSLTIEMSAINLDERAAPLAFGCHPYFPREGAWLRFRAGNVWLVGADGLPSLRVKPFGQFDYAGGAPVARADIDHCFTDWDGVAEISWPEKRMMLQIEASESLRCAVTCIRSDIDVFCFEPVPHINDALNRSDRAHAMPVIAPGQSFNAVARFRAAARASD